MLGLRVPLAQAQRTKKELLAQERLIITYKTIKEGEHLILPVTKRFESPHTFVNRDFKPINKKPTLKEALKHKLPATTLERLKTAYDQVGDIAILEIDDEHNQYEQTIGETLLEINPRLKTVLAKDDKHQGEYRTQQMRHVAGEDKRTSNHKENNVVLKVDVEDVYFSSRLATERKRIASLVKPGEEVLVMFSGCGPYQAVIAKNTKAARVVGVEINPKGHELAEHNTRLNKLGNVTNHCGDAREVVPRLGAFDRVIMPLPKDAEHFLDTALGATKKGGMVHFYAFLPQDEFSQAEEWIQDACAAEGRKCSVLRTVVCGQQAPRVFRICVDFKVS